MTSPTVDDAAVRGGAVRLVDVRAEAIDPAELIAAVSDPAAGGIDVFLGAVRDHDHGRGVSALEYVGHPTAQARLAEVAAGIVADFDVVAVAAVHRIGPLEIGDLAVVCAVSAGHRPEAFAATRALIDRLKEQVPIWKHQHYLDGAEDWVEPGSC